MTTALAPQLMQDRHIVVDAKAADFAAIRDLVTSETPILHESHSDDLSQVVVKPWGHESRVYADPVYDLWHLCIVDGAETSMHAHLRKTTELLCLSGSGVFDTLGGSYEVTAGTVMTIGPGAFHRTRSTSAELHLIEVEHPRNKFDLLRLGDRYDRSKTTYESKVTTAGESKLKELRQVPHTQLRRISTAGKFEFTLRTGMDIFYTPRPNELFYVPTGFEAFISRHPVLPSVPGVKTPVLTDQTYLAISAR
ncbi:cupin domain-containing protein [Nocardia suismassiliense]|uniref:Cupin domain-containing protein n=1 Tax=Nocardia suismassiliense TaxID=2077092 RepID=A0ABW6R217_9NOCA